MCIEYSFYGNVELQKNSSILCIDKEGNLIINSRNVILGSIKRKKKKTIPPFLALKKLGHYRKNLKIEGVVFLSKLGKGMFAPNLMLREGTSALNFILGLDASVLNPMLGKGTFAPNPLLGQERTRAQLHVGPGCVGAQPPVRKGHTCAQPPVGSGTHSPLTPY